MTKYREILRLSSLGLSQQNIADSCNVSKKTVNRVLRRANELDISCPLVGRYLALFRKHEPLKLCVVHRIIEWPRDI